MYSFSFQYISTNKPARGRKVKMKGNMYEDGKPNAGRKRKSSSENEEQEEPSRPEPRTRRERTAKKPKIQSNPGRSEINSSLPIILPKKSSQKCAGDDENKIGELPNLPQNIDLVV
jgi:hypothetical protein